MLPNASSWPICSSDAHLRRLPRSPASTPRSTYEIVTANTEPDRVSQTVPRSASVWPRLRPADR
jgi:hypothetical protein